MTPDPAAEIIDRLPGWLVDVIEQRYGQLIAAQLRAERNRLPDDSSTALILERAAVIAEHLRVGHPEPPPQHIAP